MEEMQNQEIVKEVVEEFSHIQQWMLEKYGIGKQLHVK